MLNKFDYYRPTSLENAVAYLNENSETKILAGGTDLLISLHKNKETCKHILDIKEISELKEFSYTPGKGYFIGASIIVNKISEDRLLREKYPAISQGADVLASYQVRNRATMVGNICNASPGADLAAPLLVYNAKVHIASSEGTRAVELCEFFTGVKKTVLKPNELVVGISVPDVEPGDRSVYLRKARIKGADLCNVAIALRITPEKKVIVALGAVSTTPMRLYELEEKIAERELTPELGDWLAEEIKGYINPRRDSIRSSPEYRYLITGVLAKRGWLKLMDKEAI
ncbi:MAG: xanthine dehydrogenase family protein subunit M [Sedimentibacter sp.]